MPERTLSSGETASATLHTTDRNPCVLTVPGRESRAERRPAPDETSAQSAKARAGLSINPGTRRLDRGVETGFASEDRTGRKQDCVVFGNEMRVVALSTQATIPIEA
jgi:hypothetical protein